MSFLGRFVFGFTLAMSASAGSVVRADELQPYPGELCQARASVIYICNQVGYLQVQTLGYWGFTQVFSYFAGNTAKCREQADILVERRSSVFHPTILALCSEVGYLSKYAVGVDGSIQNLGHNFLGNRETCMQQATTINSQP